METNIESDFDGLNQYNIYEMSNGTVWFQTQYAYEYHYAYRPKAFIFMKNGMYYLSVEGIRRDAQVEQVSYKKLRINYATNSFGNKTNSAGANNQYIMSDGSVWKQQSLELGMFLDNAKAIIVQYGSMYYMKIDGVDKTIRVY